MQGKTNHSYEYIIFQELVHEYDASQQKKVEAKIKRRLKYYKLAPYNQESVDYIRRFKNELYSEIHLMQKSKYYRKTPSPYAEVEDFNVKQMVKDYGGRYARLSTGDITDMIGWGVHWFYTR